MQGIEHYNLLIGGVDPTCGAGVFADYETCLNAQSPALVVVSANTIQNNKAFYAVQWTNKEWMKEQIKLLLSTYSVKTVKIGLIENPYVLFDVTELIHSHASDIKIIWDPIRSSTSGYSFYPWTIKDIEPLLSQIYLITPNRAEFDGIRNGMSEDEALDSISSRCNLLIKAYRSTDTIVEDVLIMNIRREYFQSNRRLNHHKVRGTGCRLSSGIAAYLTKGEDLKTAYLNAGVLLERHIEKNYQIITDEIEAK